ncbi:MAG TPA: hypothetical protein VNZ58_10400 [Thermomicrobiales bacterium]|nr:hypothetical protein [Thermomicrobiales bacterium]
MNQTSTNRREIPAIRLLAILMLAAMLLAPLAPRVAAQDQPAEPKPTQDPALQLPNDPTAPQPTGEETPVATETAPTPEPSQGEPSSNAPKVTRSTQRNDAATGPGFPAVLAHGLAYVSGDDVVWQVRETDMPTVDKARSTTSGAAIMLQRDGSSIVRNDVTGKRAKVDPGEAYFRAAGDGYTVMAEDDTSVVWTFELVNPNDVAMDAFYEGPKISNLSEGVYDMMLTRYVLTPGDQVDLPDHNGAGLVMGASGEIEVNAGGQRSALEPGDGQTIQDSGSVSNTGDADAVFVYVYLGDVVSDASAGAGTGQSSSATASESPAATTGSSETSDSGTTQEEPSGEEPSSPTTDAEGNYVTSINVTANAEIYLVITVDGLTVFDGNLPAGSSSGPVVGSTFVVYTSSGENTVFTNACGDSFYMGYEAGEATYTLNASAESCAP